MSQEHEAAYSQIIAADMYNRLMTEEHLYIAEADTTLQRIVRRYAQGTATPKEVIDIGCGPVRLTPLLARVPNTHVFGLDHDAGWLHTAQTIIDAEQLPITLAQADIETYTHPKAIDIAISQGSHHHIQKGQPTQRYLENVRRQLAPDGVFVVSDEMIPYYASEEERLVRLCIWYSHIINHALNQKHEELGIAEMETLLDDLFEGSGERASKSTEQMRLVREYVPRIAEQAEQDELRAAEQEAERLLGAIQNTQTTTAEPPLSRGDYKICFAVFEKEIQDAGYKIRETKTIGPIETIGGFGIYTLEAAP